MPHKLDVQIFNGNYEIDTFLKCINLSSKIKFTQSWIREIAQQSGVCLAGS